jgi:hypothetical protein
MNGDAEHHHLTEQLELEILKKLKARYGNEAIEIASQARLGVHQSWIRTAFRGIQSFRIRCHFSR